MKYIEYHDHIYRVIGEPLPNEYQVEVLMKIHRTLTDYTGTILTKEDKFRQIWDEESYE